MVLFHLMIPQGWLSNGVSRWTIRHQALASSESTLTQHEHKATLEFIPLLGFMCCGLNTQGFATYFDS